MIEILSLTIDLRKYLVTVWGLREHVACIHKDYSIQTCMVLLSKNVMSASSMVRAHIWAHGPCRARGPYRADKGPFPTFPTMTGRIHTSGIILAARHG